MYTKFKKDDYVVPRTKPLDSGGKINKKKIINIGFMCGILPIYHLESELQTYTDDELMVVS